MNPIIHVSAGGEKRLIRFDSTLSKEINVIDTKGHSSDVLTDITLNCVITSYSIHYTKLYDIPISSRKVRSFMRMTASFIMILWERAAKYCPKAEKFWDLPAKPAFTGSRPKTS